MLCCVQDYVILCLDTGPSMDSAPLDVSETRLKSSVKIASRIVQQKVALPSSNECTFTITIPFSRCLLEVKTLWG